MRGNEFSLNHVISSAYSSFSRPVPFYNQAFSRREHRYGVTFKNATIFLLILRRVDDRSDAVKKNATSRNGSFGLFK